MVVFHNQVYMRKKKIVAIGNLCIPHQIIFEILKEVPAKSLMRFRCVSKLFCSLISEPLFIEAHQKAQFHVSGSSLTTREDVLQYLNQSCFCGLDNLEYANGLVCLWNDVGEVAICNPFTKEYVFLPRQNPKEKGSMICCSMGFDPITKKHKVFKVHIIKGDQNSCGVRYWVFTIGVDKSWREIADCTNFFPARYKCVYIGGVIYCVNSFAKLYNLAAFSVGDEKLIRMILSPVEVLTSNFPPKILEIKGQVALLDRTNFPADICLYAFNDTGENEEWVKHIIELPSIIPMQTIFCPLFSSTPKGEIVLINPDSTSRIYSVFLCDIAKKGWKGS